MMEAQDIAYLREVIVSAGVGSGNWEEAMLVVGQGMLYGVKFLFHKLMQDAIHVTCAGATDC